jgi:threonine dehydratase
LGQGTIGLEIEEQSPDVDTLLVAVGGGGLIAGIAAWFGGKVKVVGVEPEGSPTLTMSIKAGGPVDAPAGGIAADSLAPRRVGTLVYPIAKRHVDPVVVVPDDAIKRAQLALWETLRVVAEPEVLLPLQHSFRVVMSPARRAHRNCSERRQYHSGQFRIVRAHLELVIVRAAHSELALSARK